ncbi:adenine deaminase [bacterium]|nr:adenine deaminase [bacterium]
MDKVQKKEGNIVDLIKQEIYPATIFCDENGKITKVEKNQNSYKNYILPGFIDSHVHIESSMLVPSEFAKAAVSHGTVAVVTDPHEIGNVLGKKGVKYMIKNSRDLPFYFAFGAPSCVPASPFETSGTPIDSNDIIDILEYPEVTHLSEVMNFPAVINGDPILLHKIEAAKSKKLPIDGHAPSLRGDDLKKYISAGISTDHESTTFEEAVEKISLGMTIQIREGSGAKDFDNLYPLISKYSDSCMFCSDDIHPDDLKKGHINRLVSKSIKNGISLFDTLKVAILNPIKHYSLKIGLLQKGDSADWIEVNDLVDFKIIETVIQGDMVFKNGVNFFPQKEISLVNAFSAQRKILNEIKTPYKDGLCKIISVTEGSLYTKKIIDTPNWINGFLESNIEKDYLRAVVVNRYGNQSPSLGLIHGFGLKRGAIASSIAHDAHNIVAIGVKDEDILLAINLLIEFKGGLVVVDSNDVKFIHLPVAGLMSDKSIDDVAKLYEELNIKVKELGCKINNPFITLSFVSLSVIPELKLCDVGLFDSLNFKLTSFIE